MNSFRHSTLAALLLALAPLARGQDDLGTAPQALPTADLKIGAATLHTELALTPHEDEVGLMFRRTMPDNNGMLFLLPGTMAEFWMKNTYLPLSVAFLGRDGTILEIHDMKALDLSITRSDSDRVYYAIEANLHWFDLNGIKPGVKIALPAAVLARPLEHAAAP